MPLRRGILLVGLFAAASSADTVQLPYVAPDAGNSQWFVQQMGILQQQGNQPVFSQAGVLTVNGQQPQRNVNTADVDDKAKELTLTFMPVGALRITRRIKFDDGIVRIVDVFENLRDQEASVNLSLMTNTNFGVNDTQPIVDPKKKDLILGWAANTGAERAAVSIFGGKGAKVVPNVQFQPNNNAVNATMQLKVPGKQKRAIVHWHGTFDNADAGVAWAAQSRESKLTADLPADIRRAIVNLGVSSASLPDGLELLRGGASDVIELRDGAILRGDLASTAYVMQTDYGDVTVPAEQVSGLLAVGMRQWLATAAGELFAGRLKQGDVAITLAGGQSVRVPIDRIARLGYRSASAEAPDWKFDQPMAFLASGERFLVDAPKTPFTFVSRYGTLTLQPAQVACLLLSPASSTHQIYLTDGSRLTGVLTGTTMSLARFAATQPAELLTASLARVQLKKLDETIGAGAATVGLLGDDMVAAKIDQPLKLTTAFDTLTITGAEVRSITRPHPGRPDVQLTTADQSTFLGTLSDATLTLTLGSGVQLTVPTAALRDYDNPSPFPSASVVTKANDAIKRLNSDDWKERETAEKELTATGAGIVSVMESALPNQPPEARDRLTAILKALRKDQPTMPTRLTPPPAVE